MREIKFRAWLKEKKAMVSVFHWHKGDEIDCIEVLTSFNDSTRIGSNDYELMQFTGLKDKVGTDIYEGDVLEHVSDKSVTAKKVVYSNQHGAFIMECGKYFSELKATYWDENMYADNYVVIGNIYENPNSLNEAM